MIFYFILSYITVTLLALQLAIYFLYNLYTHSTLQTVTHFLSPIVSEQTGSSKTSASNECRENTICVQKVSVLETFKYGKLKNKNFRPITWN